MRNNHYRKLVVFGLLLLLCSTNVISSYGQIHVNQFSLATEKDGLKPLESNFDQQIALYMKLGHMPSLSACIIKNNSVKWVNTYGYSNRETLNGATPDTIYMVASISKSIAAVAVMQLLENGLIHSLDDDVNDYLGFSLRNPNYPTTNITFRMLLAHQSSLISYDVPMFISFSLLGYPRAWIKEFLTPDGRYYYPNIWLGYPPGQKEHYASLNFEIIAYLVERIAQQPYEQYVKKHIFQPLNMSSTSYFLSELNASNLAVPYIWMAGRYIRLPFYENHNAGAGGVRTTVLDLSHYLIMHMNGGMYNDIEILTNVSVDEIHRGQYTITSDNNFSFGLGWYSFRGLDGNMYGGHDGTIPGGRSVMRMRYTDNVGVIFFYNRYQLIFDKEKCSPIRIFTYTIGQIEQYARQKVEQLLFEKVEML
jgi:CubicO group peptidase (beta-lactamase class C family)